MATSRTIMQQLKNVFPFSADLKTDDLKSNPLDEITKDMDLTKQQEKESELTDTLKEIITNILSIKVNKQFIWDAADELLTHSLITKCEILATSDQDKSVKKSAAVLLIQKAHAKLSVLYDPLRKKTTNLERAQAISDFFTALRIGKIKFPRRDGGTIGHALGTSTRRVFFDKIKDAVELNPTLRDLFEKFPKEKNYSMYLEKHYHPLIAHLQSPLLQDRLKKLEDIMRHTKGGSEAMGPTKLLGLEFKSNSFKIAAADRYQNYTYHVKQICVALLSKDLNKLLASNASFPLPKITSIPASGTTKEQNEYLIAEKHILGDLLHFRELIIQEHQDNVVDTDFDKPSYDTLPNLVNKMVRPILPSLQECIESIERKLSVTAQKPVLSKETIEDLYINLAFQSIQKALNDKENLNYHMYLALYIQDTILDKLPSPKKDRLQKTINALLSITKYHDKAKEFKDLELVDPREIDTQNFQAGSQSDAKLDTLLAQLKTDKPTLAKDRKELASLEQNVATLKQVARVVSTKSDAINAEYSRTMRRLQQAQKDHKEKEGKPDVDLQKQLDSLEAYKASLDNLYRLQDFFMTAENKVNNLQVNINILLKSEKIDALSRFTDFTSAINALQRAYPLQVSRSSVSHLSVLSAAAPAAPVPPSPAVSATPSPVSSGEGEPVPSAEVRKVQGRRRRSSTSSGS